MKWLRRVLVGIPAVLLIVLVAVGAIILLDGASGASASDYTNVTYTAEDGTELHAYLAMPDDSANDSTDENEGLPAVIMVHEWWGINEEITEMADRLAEEGYIVLAPDTYRGETTRQIPRALFLRLSTPEERVDADMRAAFDYLVGLDNVDVQHVGVMGFCYGGGVALRHGVDNPQIAAVINLYGDTILDPADFGALLNDEGAPVLGIFGEVDAQIPLEEVAQFEEALAEANIDHTVTIYPDQGHAFVTPHNIDEEGEPRDAWLQILDFLAIHLQLVDETEASDA
jgi:carboxymethylenebutenolidase